MPDQRLVLITLRSEERNPSGSRPTGLVYLETGAQKTAVEANVQNLSEQGGYYLFIAGEKTEKLELHPNARGFGIKHEIMPGRVKAALVGKYEGENLRFLLSGVALGNSVNMERLKTDIRIQFGKKQENPLIQLSAQAQQKPAEEQKTQVRIEDKIASQSKESELLQANAVIDRPGDMYEKTNVEPNEQHIPQPEIPPYDVAKGSAALKGILKRASVLFPKGESAGIDLNQSRIKSKVYAPKSMNEEQKRWYMDVDKMVSMDHAKTEEPAHNENPLEFVRRKRPIARRSIPNPFPGEFKQGVWYMARYTGMISRHYIIGRIKKNGRYLTVIGVPGEYSVNPPPWLAGFSRFVTSVFGAGYWLQLIDIATGKPVAE